MLNFKNINQNETQSSQTKDNPYFIIPEDNGINRLSIPKNKQAFFIALFMSLGFMICPIPPLVIFKVIQYPDYRFEILYSIRSCRQA